MDHLNDGFIEAGIATSIRCLLTNEQRDDVRALWDLPAFGYNEFVTFLEDRNWTADRVDGFILKKADKKPKKQSQSKKDRKGGDKKILPEYGRWEMLQAWLFFALTACVVRNTGETNPSGIGEKQNWHSGVTNVSVFSEGHGTKAAENATRPLLTFDALTKRSDLLSTQQLPRALQEWHDSMKTIDSKTRLRSRLIDVDRTLELARRVIRANLVRPTVKAEADGSANGVANQPAQTNGTPAPQRAEHSYEHDIHHAQEDFLDVSLCLMVLGETLSAAKAQIMSDLGLKINGWLVDDDDGWGPPLYVLSKMQTNWCPRAQAVLQGQLGSSAILLFTAWAMSILEDRDKTEHQGCSAEECLHVPGMLKTDGGTTFYPPQHYYRCISRNEADDAADCRLFGPNIQSLYEILGNKTTTSAEGTDFPILRIVTKESKEGRCVVGVTVERWGIDKRRPSRQPSFTAISHVWSQGLGNEMANTLRECQLELILAVLEESEGGRNNNWIDRESPSFVSSLLSPALGDEYNGDRESYQFSSPFWLDTLAVPVKTPKVPANFKAMKQRAIRQIYHVFSSASKVVVIDKKLCGELPSSTFKVVLNILISAWMQRLWTMQEAFLSRKILVVFQGSRQTTPFRKSRQISVKTEDVDSKIRELDRPEKDEQLLSFHASMAQLIKRKFFHNLMGEDREIRNRNEHPIETRGSMVISSAWRSTRWRNTSRLEDETLALSTLLNLDYRQTAIEEATMKEPLLATQKADGEDPAVPTDALRDERLERMMRDFWTLIHRHYEGSIPAGLIFLPGDKLSLPGFGWAPRTWMSAADEHYPYPLGMVAKPTELHDEGLLVQYPGFLLHGADPHAILGTNYFLKDVIFPVDQYLSEWYKITAVSREDKENDAVRMVISRLKGNPSPEFGIILCRPKPREWPPEIGLLVEIYRETWKRKEPGRINRKYHCCQIIRRVWISRASPSDEPKKYKIPSARTGQQPIGEALSEDTMWYVDGYRVSRDKPVSENADAPALVSDNSTPVKASLARGGYNWRPRFRGAAPRQVSQELSGLTATEEPRKSTASSGQSAGKNAKGDAASDAKDIKPITKRAGTLWWG